jgi:hypothetical protein
MGLIGKHCGSGKTNRKGGEKRIFDFRVDPTSLPTLNAFRRRAP